MSTRKRGTVQTGKRLGKSAPLKKAARAGRRLTVAGDVAVNDGDITSKHTTFNLIRPLESNPRLCKDCLHVRGRTQFSGDIYNPCSPAPYSGWLCAAPVRLNFQDGKPLLVKCVVRNPDGACTYFQAAPAEPTPVRVSLWLKLWRAVFGETSMHKGS